MRREHANLVKIKVSEIVSLAQQIHEKKDELYEALSEIAHKERCEIDGSIFDIIDDIAEGVYSDDEDDDDNLDTAVDEIIDCMIKV